MRWLLPLAGLAICLGLAWELFSNPYESPEAALEAFYGGEPRPECMQAAPLHRAGSIVVPLLIARLPDRNMPKRRYAISFLGAGRYQTAISALEVIANDTTELDYFRSDALLAISQIDLPRARELVSKLPRHTGDLDRAIQAVLQGGARLMEATYHGC